MKVCPTCGGRGDIKTEGGRQLCPECNGSGVIEAAEENGGHVSPAPEVTQLHPTPFARVSPSNYPSSLPLWVLAGLCLLTVFALALLGVLLIHEKGAAPSLSVNNANSNKNVNVNINGATATPTATLLLSATGTPATGASPGQPAQPGSAPTPTPSTGFGPETPAPGATPTPMQRATPVPTHTPAPVLAVSTYSIHLTVCVAGSASFTLSNSGGGVLNWSAKASNKLYTISPSSGSQAAGQLQTVMIGDITLNGSITVSSNGGDATIAITCG